MTLDELVKLVADATEKGKDRTINRSIASGSKLMIEFSDGTYMALRVTDFKPVGMCRACGSVLDKEEGPFCPRCEKNND